VHVETDDGKRFLQSFTQACCRAGVCFVEVTGQVTKFCLRLCCTRLVIGVRIFEVTVKRSFSGKFPITLSVNTVRSAMLKVFRPSRPALRSAA